MRHLVDAAAENGITAVIAPDISVIDYAFSSGLEVHLSTQLNISNAGALEFYSKWADVAVLARELNLEQVRHIYDQINTRNICGPGGKPVKLEMFVHGALCMAVSGKCYLSLHENNKSANRGECYQTCRKSYIVTGKESGYELEIDNEYIMSPKDLCAIGFLDRIAEAGVRVFKIEGRARSAEYVRVVSSCYDEALSAIAEGTYSAEKTGAWRERLATVFNRGFWDGYYLGQKLGEWNTRYGSSATKRKIYIGKVTNFFSKLNVAEIKLENGDLSTGDTLIITGPTTGAVELVADEIRVDLKPSGKALRGEYCSIKVPEALRRSDKVFKWVNESEVKTQ
jgi:putative protease